MNNLYDIRKAIHVDVKIPNSPFSGNRTYSTLFLAPAFELNLNSALWHYFVNAYLDDYTIEHVYKRPLFILLETRKLDDSFKRVDFDLQRNKNFRYSYVAGTHGLSFLFMYVFECPEQYTEEYDRFLKGQYSKFSERYKGRFYKIIPDSEGGFDESPISGVMYKTDKLKEKVEDIIGVPLSPSQEYFGIPDKRIEIFNYPLN